MIDYIFEARGIDKPYRFLVKAGFTPHSANVLVHDNLRMVKLDHLEILCEKLNCELNDLLLWTPDKNNPVSANHPLRNLSAKPSGQINAFRDLPYKELKELASKLTAGQKEIEG